MILVHNYPNEVDEQYVIDWIFISAGLYCGLFTSKDFAATVFTVGEEAMSYQTHNKTTKIKLAIHMILTFPLTFS